MVIRVNKSNDYTIMSNHHFRNKNLTLRAKGLLSQMLSLPDDWDYSVDGLVAINKEGKETIQGALKELEQEGYLVRTRVQNEKGQFEYIYDVYETPTDQLINQLNNQEKLVHQLTNQEEAVNPTDQNEELTDQPRRASPCTVEPRTVSPRTVKPPQLNTNNKILKNNRYTGEIEEIIAYLNQKTGRKFRVVESNAKHIRARLREGYSTDELKAVVDKKCQEWLNDSARSQFLRPTTLFGDKFDSYLNAPVSSRSNFKPVLEVASYWNSSPVRGENAAKLSAEELEKAQKLLASRGSHK